MLPIAELRGGLPLGISLGISPFKAYLISVIGNVIPVLPCVPLKYSFPAIFAGICIAGIIVLFATLGVFGLGRIFSGM